MDKKDYVSNLATSLVEQKKTMTFIDLAKKLNEFGFKTIYGTPYKENGRGRGIARLCHCVYDTFKNLGLQDKADDIATAFVKQNGSYAYE